MYWIRILNKTWNYYSTSHKSRLFCATRLRALFIGSDPLSVSCFPRWRGWAGHSYAWWWCPPSSSSLKLQLAMKKTPPLWLEAGAAHLPGNLAKKSHSSQKFRFRPGWTTSCPSCAHAQRTEVAPIEVTVVSAPSEQIPSFFQTL